MPPTSRSSTSSVSGFDHLGHERYDEALEVVDAREHWTGELLETVKQAPRAHGVRTYDEGARPDDVTPYTLTTYDYFEKILEFLMGGVDFCR